MYSNFILERNKKINCIRWTRVFEAHVIVVQKNKTCFAAFFYGKSPIPNPENQIHFEVIHLLRAHTPFQNPLKIQGHTG